MSLQRPHSAASVSVKRLPPETVLFSAFSLLAFALIGLRMPLPPPIVQVVVLALLVGVLGLPHGALDPLIARRAGLWRRPLGFVGFNLGYLALVGAVVGIWLAAPGPSLAFFLVISGIHFGADWNAGRSIWLRVPPGLALLTLPAWGHPAEVTAVYRTLAGSDGAVIANLQFALGPVALGVMLLGAVVAVRARPHQTVEMLLAAVLAVVAPPLVFFVVYFCALHSVRHLIHGFRVERAASRAAENERATRRAITPAVAASTVVTQAGFCPSLGAEERDDRSGAARGRPIPWSVVITVGYTLGPILVVGALWGSVGTDSLSDRMTQLVFIALAALTVPHMVVVAAEQRAGRRGQAS